MTITAVVLCASDAALGMLLVHEREAGLEPRRSIAGETSAYYLYMANSL